MNPRLIKTEADYEQALMRVEELFDARAGTPEGEELELIAALIEMHEEEAFPIDAPDPIEAIRFRMDQQGLKNKDLEPFIGSKSKVSEVLSGKRNLSLTMIRNLAKGLGIPAEVLIQEPDTTLPSEQTLKEWRHFPIAEMVRRGWFVGFEGTVQEARQEMEDLLSGFVSSLGRDALVPAMNRMHVREGGKFDPYSLTAWRVRVANLAMNQSLPEFESGTVTPDFLRELAKLSYLDSGPLLAQEFLSKSGIHLVIERHLPKTHLDGAAFKLPTGAPVVALTLRFDRLDHFWFTLFHELAHVALHLYQDEVDAFFDEIGTNGQKDALEKEADRLAAESLIPPEEWEKAALDETSHPDQIRAFAESLRINVAIPAGRIRHESGNYKAFSQLVGNRKVRRMFSSQEL